MLPKNRRLRSSEELKAVLKTGGCVSTPEIRACALKQAASPSRVAVIVGKRVDKRATARHRYQRWLRVLAREYLEGVSSASYDMVWVAQPAIARHDTLATLRQSVADALGRLTNKL